MKVNRLIGVLLAMSLCVSSMGVPAFAVNNDDVPNLDKIMYIDKVNERMEELGYYGTLTIIDVTIPIDIIPDSGFVVVPVESCIVLNDQDGLLRGNPDQTVTKRFLFNLYDKNGIYCGAAGIGITGIYSSIDAASEITDVQVVYDGPYADSFTYTTSKSGNRASVTLRIDGKEVKTFDFQISITGSITYTER